MPSRKLRRFPKLYMKNRKNMPRVYYGTIKFTGIAWFWTPSTGPLPLQASLSNLADFAFLGFEPGTFISLQKPRLLTRRPQLLLRREVRERLDPEIKKWGTNSAQKKSRKKGTFALVSFGRAGPARFTIFQT